MGHDSFRGLLFDSYEQLAGSRQVVSNDRAHRLEVSTGSSIVRLTRIDFPSRLSVSSKVPLLNRFTETLLNPGSPLQHEPNLNRGTVRTQS